MKTSQMFGKRTVFSLEIFPPKPTTGVETIYRTLEELSNLKPDFISVTYGAGGKNGAKTLELAEAIKTRYGTESVAHLSGMYLTRDDVIRLTNEFRERGIENILALRGDRVEGLEPTGDFPHASDLAAFIRELGDFNIIGACYPEGHPESASTVDDIHNLKRKVDAGVSHLISQLFFDNDIFYDFLERAQIAGINVPIEAGIMPVVNSKQIGRIIALCGVKMPRKFMRIMERYQDKPLALRDAGIAYAVDQIVDLVTQGVDGIHLYTMNQPYVARRIWESVGGLITESTFEEESTTTSNG